MPDGTGISDLLLEQMAAGEEGCVGGWVDKWMDGWVGGSQFTITITFDFAFVSSQFTIAIMIFL